METPNVSFTAHYYGNTSSLVSCTSDKFFLDLTSISVYSTKNLPLKEIHLHLCQGRLHQQIFYLYAYSAINLPWLIPK